MSVIGSPLTLGGVSVDLLWTNSDPSASFAAQTVALDLSGYSMVMITFVWGSAGEWFTQVFEMDHKSIAFRADRANSGGRLYNCIRPVTTSSTGVVFGAATEGNGSSTSTTNGNIIPAKIYGVKF